MRFLLLFKIFTNLGDQAGEIEAHSGIDIRIVFPQVILLHSQKRGVRRLPIPLKHKMESVNVVVPDTKKEIYIIFHRIEIAIKIRQVSSFYLFYKISKSLKLIPKFLQPHLFNYHMHFLPAPGPKDHHSI